MRQGARSLSGLRTPVVLLIDFSYSPQNLLGKYIKQAFLPLMNSPRDHLSSTIMFQHFLHLQNWVGWCGLP